VSSRVLKRLCIDLLRPARLFAALSLWLVSVHSSFLVCQAATSPVTPEQAVRNRPKFVLEPRIPVNPPNVGYAGQVLLAADPESDSNLIVCGFRENQRTGSAYEGYVYQSSDAGKTWHEVLVDAESQWVSEESCAFGPGHQAYFVTGVSNTAHGPPQHTYGNLHLYHSTDGGRTWRTMLVNRFMDWTSMAIDATAGPRRNTIYIFANLLADGLGGWMSAEKRPFLASIRESPKLDFSVTDGDFNGSDVTAKSGKYPASSVVLSDGTVLAIFKGYRALVNKTTSRATRLFSVELGSSNDGGHTLKKTIVSESDIPLAVTGLSVNPLTDEIYICWTPDRREPIESKIMDEARSEIVVASSRDMGKTWTVRTVKGPQGQPLDVSPATVSLAVNKDGVLGFMWYSTNWRHVYFGISRDGGDSIVQIAELTPHFSENLRSDATAADERRLFVYPPVWDGSSGHSEPIRILSFGPNPRGVPWGNGLVASPDSTFHAVWSEVDNGPTHLWTRAISFPLPGGSARVSNLHGLTDVSERVVAHISNVRFDHLDNLVAFDIIVANKSEKSIGGPVFACLASSSEQLNFLADNADNQELGDGALWQIQIALEGLGYQQSSEPRTLIFRPNPKIDDSALRYRVRDIPLRIYGKLP
jgi:hypothetical protein